jgi:hypothetical protein
METSGIVGYKNLRSQSAHARTASDSCMHDLVFIFCLGCLTIPEVPPSTKVTISAFSVIRSAYARNKFSGGWLRVGVTSRPEDAGNAQIPGICRSTAAVLPNAIRSHFVRLSAQGQKGVQFSSASLAAAWRMPGEGGKSASRGHLIACALLRFARTYPSDFSPLVDEAHRHV